MTAKEELWQVRRAANRVRRREEEIAMLESLIEGSAVKVDGLPKGSSGGDKLAVQVGRLVELKGFLACEIETFLDEREKALAVIGGIRNESMRDVLVYRYIVGLGWPEVAEKMHYSVDHVYRLHGWALKAYEVCERSEQTNAESKGKSSRVSAVCAKKI